MSVTLNASHENKRRWLIGFIRECFADPTVREVLNKNFNKPTDSDTWLWDAMIFCMIDNKRNTKKVLIRNYELLEKLAYEKLSIMSEQEREEVLTEELSKFESCNVPSALKTLRRTFHRVASQQYPRQSKEYLMRLPEDRRLFEISTIWGVDRHNAESIIEDSKIQIDFIDYDFLSHLTSHLLPKQITERTETVSFFEIIANIAGMLPTHFIKLISKYKDYINYFMIASTPDQKPIVPVFEPIAENGPENVGIPQKKTRTQKKVKVSATS